MWELEALGLPEALRNLHALSAGLDDADPFLTGDAARIAGDSVRGNFLAAGRPDAWPDITARSRAQRKVNRSSGPLIDSGALMEAASATGPGVPGSLFAVEGDTLTEGTDLVYAGVQNFGWEQKNVPARPYEEIQPEDELRLAVAFQDDYLHRLLAAWP